MPTTQRSTSRVILLYETHSLVGVDMGFDVVGCGAVPGEPGVDED